MKKSIILFVVLITLGFGQDVFSKDFSGIIIYNITYDEAKMDPQMVAMMPKTMKMMINDGKVRTEVSMGGMGKNVSIFDSETKSGVTLMDMMGQKYAIELNAEDIEKQLDDGPKVKVEKLSDTKEIAGYTCNKAVVKVLKANGETEYEVEVCYTNELGSGGLNMDDPMFKDIDGVMMEYSIKEENMNMKFSAISVDQKKVSDSEFEIPEGYKKVSQEELQQMFGG